MLPDCRHCSGGLIIVTLFKSLFGTRGSDDAGSVEKLHRQSRRVSLSLVLLVAASAALVFFVLSTDGLSRIQLALAAATLTAMLILGFGLPVLRLQQHAWDQYQQLRSILDASGTAIVLFDDSQRVRDFNATARSYYLDRGVLLIQGLLESDMVRQATRALADDEVAHQALFERAMRERGQRVSDGSAAVVCHRETNTWHQVRHIALRHGFRAELRCDVGAVVERKAASVDVSQQASMLPAAAIESVEAASQLPAVTAPASTPAVTATHPVVPKVAQTARMPSAPVGVGSNLVVAGTGATAAANDHAGDAPVVSDRLLKSGAKVLLITDDDVLGPVVSDMLITQGAAASLQSVVAMATGQELLKTYCQMRPDLMILDVSEVSPALMKSLSTLRSLERHQGWSTCPVVGISDDMKVTKRTDYLEAGMQSCLAKPVAQRALLTTVNRCLPEIDTATPAASGRERHGVIVAAESA